VRRALGPPCEPLIAGHARRRGLVVITGDLGEFCRWLDCAPRIGWQRIDLAVFPSLAGQLLWAPEGGRERLRTTVDKFPA
jgi:hypothetical protein